MAEPGAMIALAAVAAQVAAPAGAPIVPGPAGEGVAGAPADRRVFTPADFARFAPRTAADMLARVPGFVIRQTADTRGLGEASSNVLIDGRRPSGKTNDALAAVSRIPAANVVRIEIVDAATLNIAGLTGQVANVVVRTATRISGQYAWRPQLGNGVAGPRLTRFDGSASGKAGPVSWTLGLRNDAFREGAAGPTAITGADGAPIERRHDRATDSGEQPKVTAQLALDGPGSSVGTLNLAYNRLFYTHRESGTRTGPGLPDRARVELDHDRDRYGEVGGDYEVALAGGRLKLIALARDEHDPADQQVEIVADGARTGDRYASVTDQRERVARAEYRWGRTGADWQVSAERAFNRLDNRATLAALNADGAYAAVPLDGADGRVTERRYEAVVTHGRALSAALTLRLTMGMERSVLDENGGGGALSRGFWRPKGSLTAAWKAAPRLDVNAKLERVVGQLEFGDFLASVDLRLDQANAGNPALVPPQSWDGEVQATRTLGAAGTTTLRLYGRQIADLVDTVPIGADGESPGNLDDATLLGAEWKSTANLDRFGWHGARLDATVQVQGSRVRDPLLRTARSISDEVQQLAQLSLRHDVPRSAWAWGGAVEYDRYAPDYRLTQVTRGYLGPVAAELFVERKQVRGLTLRVTARNLLGADNVLRRTVFDERRDGPIAYVERRQRRTGQTIGLVVSGAF